MLASVPAVSDVIYPPFLNGSWTCERIVTSVEGDAAQAEGAWRLLGGSESTNSQTTSTAKNGKNIFEKFL